MAKVKSQSKPLQRTRPAMTPEARENQLISMAMDLAEQQLRDGTASSQVIAHFLKKGSEKERLEKERLIEENKLLRAKTETLQSQAKQEELYAEAIAAMQDYAGVNVGIEDDE